MLWGVKREERGLELERRLLESQHQMWERVEGSIHNEMARQEAVHQAEMDQLKAYFERRLSEMAQAAEQRSERSARHMEQVEKFLRLMSEVLVTFSLRKR